MSLRKKGQATLEYILALVATILFVALLLSQIDTPIKRWWDGLGRKVAAPCPTKECVDQVQPTVP
jgi:hypothetical protein